MTKTIKEMEKELILKTIKEMNGNHTKASQILGITTRTIRNKLHEYAREDEVEGSIIENNEKMPQVR